MRAFLKVKKGINRQHMKIANIRNYYLHQVSTDISKNHALVVLEDLKVANLSRSTSGTMENPGKNVTAKSGLNRSILEQGWHMFKSHLSYMLERLGGELLLVAPRYTSQECSRCHHLDNGYRKSQAEFFCLRCGHEENADVNAAKSGLVVGSGGVRTNFKLSRCDNKKRASWNEARFESESAVTTR